MGDNSPEGIVNAWSLKPTIEEIIVALRQSFEGWDGNEVVQDAGIIWSIRCHCEAIRLLEGMKEDQERN